MEQKKYKLTEETMCFDGVTLHRIQALKDFGNVEAGELGGWVESEKNLSQSGDCWIAMEAKAYGGAEIGDSAILTRKAIACGNSTICNDTLVSDESIIRGFTYLYGDVEVYGKSVIDGDARLHGNVKVIDAKVIDAEVYDRVIICDGAYVHGRIKIDGTAYISNGAEVCKTDDYIVFKNFWSSGRHFTWTRSNNKWHVGCFRGTGEELIKKAYQDSEKSGREYERVVRYVESILADEQKEQKNEWVNDFDKDRITQRLSKGLIHAYTHCRFAPYDGYSTEPFNISYVSAYIPRGTKFFVSDDHQTIGAEELYILNHMASRAFGLTDQQVYDIIALARWNRKNQKMIMIG